MRVSLLHVQKLIAASTAYCLFLATSASIAYGAVVPVPSVVFQLDTSAQARCDQLANDPDDPQRVGPGVDYHNISVSQALPACQSAVQLSPTAHYHFLYGRVLDAANRDSEALRELRAAAANGYAEAMCGLALASQVGGGGVPKSDADALVWFRRAAYAGSPRAMTNLAIIYGIGGYGVPRDEQQGAAWAFKAAQAGNLMAMFLMGAFYERGIGVAKNNVQAVAWYRKAAVAGYPIAMNNLATMYLNGQGVPENDTEAARWFQKAADQNSDFAELNLGVLYQNGTGVARDANRATELFRMAANSNDPSVSAKAKKLLNQKEESNDGLFGIALLAGLGLIGLAALGSNDSPSSDATAGNIPGAVPCNSSAAKWRENGVCFASWSDKNNYRDRLQYEQMRSSDAEREKLRCESSQFQYDSNAAMKALNPNAMDMNFGLPRPMCN